MTLRLLFVLGLLLAGSLWLMNHVATTPAIARPTPNKPTTPTSYRLRSRPLADGLSEAHYVTLGMPSLSAGWDAPTLKRVVTTLEAIRTKNTSELPGGGSVYGKAFFAKLRHTVQRFHFQSAFPKNDVFNAFRDVLPVYAKAYNDGYQCDMELALLIGLQFELIAGFVEDQKFVKDRSLSRPRIARDLDGDTWEFRGDAIYMDGGSFGLRRDITMLLDLLGNQGHLRPEARALGLHYAALHLPSITRRMDITGLASRLERNRDVEQSTEVRALYDTLISRLD